MNHMKEFFKQKGLYLFCLAMVFAATAAGILALRSVVRNVQDLTQLRKQMVEEDTVWEPDAAVNKPAEDVPKPSSVPSAPPVSLPASPAVPTPSGMPDASLAPAAPRAESLPLWASEPIQRQSGEELVYSKTLGDWRTHNGADYAAKTGDNVTPVQGGKVTAVTQDALWGGVVEVTDAQSRVWRYCGLQKPTVQEGQRVTVETVLGAVGELPAESADGTHLHLECLREGAYLDPETLK